MKSNKFRKGVIHSVNALLSLSLVGGCLPVIAQGDQPVSQQEISAAAPASLVKVNGLDVEADARIHDGDVLTYRFDWENTSSSPQAMTLYNPLGDLSSFYSASIVSSDGQSLELYNNSSLHTSNDQFYIALVDEAPASIEILNEQAEQWIVFDLGTEPAGSSGYVELSVLVQSYDETIKAISNQAYWQVDDAVIGTDKVLNYFEANNLVQTFPGNGLGVEVGDQVVYRMQISNPTGYTQPLSFTDVIDSSLIFDEATLGSLSINNVKLTDSIDGFNLEYDPASRQVKLDVAGLDPDVNLSFSLMATVAPNTNGVINQQASLTFGDTTYKTNLVQNPLPGQQIGELSPGNNEHVDEGEIITYRIYYKNDQDEDSDISIVNPLDDGVSYHSSTLGGVPVDNQVILSSIEDPIENQSTGNVVNWMLESIAPGQSGFVLLNVQVDNEIEKPYLTDQAGIQIGDGTVDKTLIKENPVILLDEGDVITTSDEVSMTETAINGRSISNVTAGANGTLVGPAVMGGDEITYSIDWSALSDASTVTITDTLDYYTEFVSAAAGGTTLSSGTSAAGTGIDISYNSSTKTVTWELTPGSMSGTDPATVTVKVLGNAYLDQENVIENSAILVEGSNSQKTSIVQNPVYPLVSLNFPDEEDLVVSGTLVSYDVNYVNNQETAQDVIVVVPLDAGLTLQNAWLSAYAGTLDLSKSATPDRTKYTADNGSYVEFYPSGSSLPSSITANGTTVELNLPSDWKTWLNVSSANGILLYYIASAPSGAGAVSFNAAVNSTAKSMITTQGIVQVGNNDGVYSTKVENNLSPLQMSLDQKLGSEAATTSALTAAPSDQITYVITLKAPTDGSSYSSMVVQAPVESGLSIVDGSITESGSYNSSTSSVEWNVGELAAGDEKTLEFKITAPASSAMVYRQSVDADFTSGSSQNNVAGPSLFFTVSGGAAAPEENTTTGNTQATNQNTATQTNTVLYVAIVVVAVAVLGYVAYAFFKNKNDKV